MSVGVLVVTHGKLGQELVATANKIASLQDVESLSIGWGDDPDEARKRLEEAVHRCNRGSGVVILTDMFGGTPTNLALTLLAPDTVEVVTGVNLAMLLKLATIDEGASLGETAQRLRSQGQKSILVASEMLASAGH